MAIALVISVSATGSTFTTGSVDTTGATLLVAQNSNFGGTPVLTDSKSNKWVCFVGQGSNNCHRMYYCINPTVGSGHTFTITSGSVGALEVLAFSGVNGVLPFDGSIGATATSTSPAGGSVTPSQNGSLIVSALGFSNTSTANSIDSSFTIQENNAASGIIGGAIAYLIQGTAGAVNPTWTLSASKVWGCTNAVFLAGTASAPGTPALVSHVSAVGTGSVTVTTGAIDTSGATLLIVNSSCDPANAPGTLTDSNGNTWVGLTNHMGTFIAERLWYAVNPTVGAGHTFTVTGGTSVSLQAAAFSGIATASPFDVEAGGTPSTTDQTVQLGSVTPSQANSLIIAGSAFDNKLPFGIDSGYLFIDSQLAGGNTGGALAYLVLATAVALNPTWCCVGSSNVEGTNAVFAPTPPPPPYVPVPLPVMSPILAQ